MEGQRVVHTAWCGSGRIELSAEVEAALPALAARVVAEVTGSFLEKGPSR